MSSTQDIINSINDSDPTPKSFFFHSPPDSPVQPPPGSNPFSNFRDSVVSKLSTLSRPGSSDGFLRPSKSKTSRPSTSDGNVTRKSEGHYRSASSSSSKAQNSDWPTEDNGTLKASRNRSAENLPTANFSTGVNRTQDRSSHRNSFLFDTEHIFRRSKARRSVFPDPLTLPPITVNEQILEDDDVIDISSPEQTPRPVQVPSDDESSLKEIRDATARSVGLHVSHSYPQDSQGPTVSPIQEEGSEIEESKFVKAGRPSITISLLDDPKNNEPVLPIFPSPQIPPFPAAYPSLSHSIIRAATFSRYEEHGLAFSHFMAKSRAWKPRLICVTSYIPASNSSSASGFLHIFKYSTPSEDNVEIDRLEISQDSVAFISDDEVGGRKQALLIAGPDAGFNSMRKNRGSQTQYKGVDTSHQICILNIEDNQEKHSWIGTVKNFILNRRYEDAGMITLDPTSETGPGDLDLALRVRVDNLNSTLPSISPVSPITFSTLESATTRQDMPSRTQSEISLEPSKRLSAVSTLRGFFSSLSLTRDNDEAPSKLSTNLLRRRSRVPAPFDNSNKGQPQLSTLKSIFRTSILANSANSQSDTFNPTGRIGSMYADRLQLGHSDLSTSGPHESHSIPGSSGLVAPAPLRLQTESLDDYVLLGPRDILPSISQEDYSPQTPEEHRAEALLALSTPRHGRQKSQTQMAPSSRYRPSIQGMRLSIKGNGRIRSPGMLEKPLPPVISLSSPPAEARRSSSETGNDTGKRYSQRFSNSSGSFLPASEYHPQSRSSIIHKSIPPPPRRPPPNFAPPPIPNEHLDNSLEKALARQSRISQSVSTSRLIIPPSKDPPTGPLPPTPHSESSSTDFDLFPHGRPRLHSAPSPSLPIKQPSQRPKTPPTERHPFSQAPLQFSNGDENRERSYDTSSSPPNRDKFLRRPLPPLPASPPENGHFR